MIIDAILVLVAVWGFYQGWSKGIIKTVLTTFSIVFGIVVAFKFTPAATRFVETAFNSDSAFNFIAGFLLAFILTMIIIRLIARFLETTLRAANINVVNQIAGGFLLASLYILLYSFLVKFADTAHIIKPETAAESRTYGFLQKFPEKMRGVYEYVKPAFRDFWRESVKFIDRMEEKSMEKTESEPTIFDIPDEENTKKDTLQ